MEWHTFQTLYMIGKNLLGRNHPTIEGGEAAFLERYLRIACEAKANGVRYIEEVVEGLSCAGQAIWMQCGRPFYNVWPVIAPSLAKVTLDVSGIAIANKLMNLPPAMVIRFAVGKELLAGQHKLRSILYHRVAPDGKPGIAVHVDAGETLATGRPHYPRSPVHWDAAFPVTEGTVEQGLLDCRDKGVWKLRDDERLAVETAVRLVVAIALMADDSSLIEPVVLADDRRKYEEATDEELKRRLVAKAVRRGVHGFDVGAHIDVDPHYRRPHFGIRWMGHGEPKTPVLRPIKGAIIKRHRITEIPTGYLSDIECEEAKA